MSVVRKSSFYAFETARRAISNSQVGLDTVGHNLSNINTSGYTRQRVDQVSWNVRGLSKFTINGSFYTGHGAMATGVSQMRDPFLDKRYRSESAHYGEYVVEQNILTDLGNIFDEVGTETGLDQAMTNLLDAITKAQQNPTNKEYAMVVRTRAEEYSKILNTYDQQLKRLQSQNHEDLSITIADELNPILQQIAELNDQITKCEVYGNPANELRDTRNLLLDELSGFMDITVREETRQITTDISVTYVSVLLNGSDDGTGNPIELINREKYAEFKYQQNADGTAGVTVMDAGGDTYGQKATDANLTTGALRAYLDMLNGDGTANSNSRTVSESARGIPFYQDYLDTMAANFAEVLNSINTAIKPTVGWTLAENPNYVAGSGEPQYLCDASGVPLLYQKGDDGNPKLDPNFPNATPPVYLSYEENDLVSPPQWQYIYKDDGSGTFVTDSAGDPILAAIDEHGNPKKSGLSGYGVNDAEYYQTYIAAVDEDLSKGRDITGNFLIVNVSSGSQYGYVKDPASPVNDPSDPAFDAENPVYLTNSRGNPIMYEMDNNGNPKVDEYGNYVEYKISAANVGISSAWKSDAQAIVISKVNNDTANVIYDTKFYDGFKNTKMAFITGQTEMNFHDAISNLQGILGLDTSLSADMLETSQTMLLTIDDQRQSISGVSENEEAIDMMVYQNAYSAASRYMTALDEALNTIINSMGLVGR
ncbi:flagellar hook-associated protein FlgK [Ruminococcaceae bacterium OttesenSCG-928-L11]|nr:flagellar hook-associated protein FlgK [Ruminococcaceae bacterium OttesenSCG-928-L11]